MKLPMLFLSCDQPCFGQSQPSGTAVNPPPGQGVICDDRLIGLVVIPKVELYGVRPGSNCIAKMQRKRGFVFSDATGMWVEDQPALTLPSFAGDSFPYLLVAAGDAPEAWKFLPAPGTGVYLLQVQGGAFSLVDATNTVAVSAICASDTAPAIIPAGCSLTGFRKLALTADRALVGLTGDDSIVRVKSLPDATPLKHPRGNFDVLSPITIQARADDGSDIPGGLPVLPTTGGGAVSDAVPCLFSPTTKKLYRSPATLDKTKTSVTVRVAAPALTLTTGWTPLGGGHCMASNVQVNYPDLLVITEVAFTNNETVNFALFVDGVNTFMWNMDSATSSSNSVTLSKLISGISTGLHTFDIRVQGTSGAATVKFSDFELITIA